MRYVHAFIDPIETVLRQSDAEMKRTQATDPPTHAAQQAEEGAAGCL